MNKKYMIFSALIIVIVPALQAAEFGGQKEATNSDNAPQTSAVQAPQENVARPEQNIQGACAQPVNRVAQLAAHITVLQQRIAEREAGIERVRKGFEMIRMVGAPEFEKATQVEEERHKALEDLAAARQQVLNLGEEIAALEAELSRIKRQRDELELMLHLQQKNNVKR